MTHEEETIVPTRLKEKHIRCRIATEALLVNTAGAERAAIRQMENNVKRAIPEPCATCGSAKMEVLRHHDIMDSVVEVVAHCAHGRNAHCPDEIAMTYEEVENNFKKFGQNLPPKDVEIKEELPTSYGDW